MVVMVVMARIKKLRKENVGKARMIPIFVLMFYSKYCLSIK